MESENLIFLIAVANLTLSLCPQAHSILDKPFNSLIWEYVLLRDEIVLKIKCTERKPKSKFLLRIFLITKLIFDKVLIELRVSVVVHDYHLVDTVSTHNETHYEWHARSK